jgi:hypothetical protein
MHQPWPVGTAKKGIRVGRGEMSTGKENSSERSCVSYQQQSFSFYLGTGL